MNFKKEAKIVTDGFLNDLFEDYIVLDKVLENKKDIEKIKEAISTINKFREEAENQDILEYM